MKVFVTGAAGFIASTLADALLACGDSVIGYDNMSTGSRRFIAEASANPAYRFVEGDLLDRPALQEAMSGADFVCHLAANADVRFGPDRPGRDLEQNTIATFNVLEAMRATGVTRIAFSSTGSVYGESTIFPTPEDAPFPIQTSLYGASKLACEGLLSAYCEAYQFQAVAFRFVSILGPRYTHGHVFDFLKQLRHDPRQLHVLGDGLQRKSYLHIDDCVSAVLTAMERDMAGYAVYNLGTAEYCAVNDSIGWIVDELGLSPTRVYSGGERGWIGDNPFIFLDCARIRQLGWAPKRSIEESIRSTVRWLRDNPWVFDARAL